MKIRIRLVCLGASLVLGSLVSGQSVATADDAPHVYSAVSRPADVRDLAFPVRGLVADMTAKPGDEIRKGDLLGKLEDGIELAELEISRLRAEDNTPVKRANNALQFREQDLRLTRESFDDGGASESDLREAEFLFEQAKLDLADSEREFAEAQSALIRAEEFARQRKLVSPIDATVLEVTRKSGETVDETTAVVTIISIDPLLLDVAVEPIDAIAVKAGDPVEVQWQDIGDVPASYGRVIFRSPSGHGSARKIGVRIEVPNPDSLPSGLHAWVRFLDGVPEPTTTGPNGLRGGYPLTPVGEEPIGSERTNLNATGGA